MSNQYPFSVFYFTKSVFDEVGKNNPKAIELIFKAILMNTRFREKIGTSITFTSQEVYNKVKEEPYIEKFRGFMALGKNIAFPEESSNVRGTMDFRIVQFAISKDGDVLGIVKIIADDYVTKNNIKKIIEDDGYPLGVVSCQEAIEELEVIERRLKEIFEKPNYDY